MFNIECFPRLHTGWSSRNYEILSCKNYSTYNSFNIKIDLSAREREKKVKMFAQEIKQKDKRHTEKQRQTERQKEQRK